MNFEHANDIQREDGSFGPRRAVQYVPSGPYSAGKTFDGNSNNVALKCLMKSTRWRPQWKNGTGGCRSCAGLL